MLTALSHDRGQWQLKYNALPRPCENRISSFKLSFDDARRDPKTSEMDCEDEMLTKFRLMEKRAKLMGSDTSTSVSTAHVWPISQTLVFAHALGAMLFISMITAIGALSPCSAKGTPLMSRTSEVRALRSQRSTSAVSLQREPPRRSPRPRASR